MQDQRTKKDEGEKNASTRPLDSWPCCFVTGSFCCWTTDLKKTQVQYGPGFAYTFDHDLQYLCSADCSPHGHSPNGNTANGCSVLRTMEMRAGAS